MYRALVAPPAACQLMVPRPAFLAAPWGAWQSVARPSEGQHRGWGRPASSGVLAAAKRAGSSGSRNKRKGGKKPHVDEVAQFEQLMCDWDDAFAADCADTEKAALMARLAQEGYRDHGRGFVFVRSRLEKQKQKKPGRSSSGKGFGAVAPQQPQQEAGVPLPTNPELRLVSWAAAYIPGSQLDSMGGLFSAVGDGAALLPDGGSLLTAERGGGSSSGGTSGGGSGLGTATDAAVAEELQRVLRGQDLSQLRSYVGLPQPADCSSSGSGGGGGSADGDALPGGELQAEAEAATAAMMGLRRYEPEDGELVVLLAARIAGAPATGAELLVAVQNEQGGTVLELPDGWEAALAAA